MTFDCLVLLVLVIVATIIITSAICDHIHHKEWLKLRDEKDAKIDELEGELEEANTLLKNIKYMLDCREEE